MIQVVYLYSVQVKDLRTEELLLKESFKTLEDAMGFFSMVDADLNHENTAIFLAH
jgi:hypothetical protein